MDKEMEKKFKDEVMRYLSFADRHKALAEKIASEAAERAVNLFGQSTGRLTFEQQVKLATHSCIRHDYTDYDDILIEETVEYAASLFDKDSPLDGIEQGQQTEPVDKVIEFIEEHRR